MADIDKELDAGIFSRKEMPETLNFVRECQDRWSVHWQHASAQDDAAIWDDLARELLRAASAERRVRIKDDILLLVLVACDRAMQADPAAFAMMARIEREAA